MAEVKRIIPCNECDHLCDKLESDTCVGRLTKEERQAVYDQIAWAYLNNAQTVTANPEKLHE